MKAHNIHKMILVGLILVYLAGCSVSYVSN